MKVRTLKPHWNKHGTFDVGDEYDSKNPQADIILGHVDANNNETGGVQGPGAKAGPGKGSDSQKQDAEGSKAGG